MFHIASKILHFLSTPVTWVFISLLAALWWRNKRKGKRLLIVAFVLFYTFSNEFVFNTVVGTWEPPMTDLNSIDSKYKIGVVLGGYSVYAPGVDQVNFSESSDRFTTALKLYRQGVIKKIMICGGQGNIFGFTETEGTYIGRFTEQIGIPKRDIIVEPNSKNTYQNAVECKKILDSLRINEEVILLTSTTHMPRSSACFSKVGIPHKPVLVDGITGPQKLLFDYLFIPNAYVLFAWNKIFHEWIGLVVYNLVGYN
jgi:uncharacterized SAM-binding protein YcdF (DUF218 family)